MSSSSSLSLSDFTAYELPTKRWMKLVRPKMRLRLRVEGREFVSSTVKVVYGRQADETSFLNVRWAWNDDERFTRPSIADDEVFEVEIERRFLLWYKCIRRTKPVTIDQIRTGNQCALALYDGQHFTEMLEDRIEIGEITFSLQGDVVNDDSSSQSSWASSAAYS